MVLGTDIYILTEAYLCLCHQSSEQNSVDPEPPEEMEMVLEEWEGEFPAGRMKVRKEGRV